MGRTAQNLNSMLDRIEELVESNRQVSDNVAPTWDAVDPHAGPIGESVQSAT
jgi:hypothetical protein